MEAKMFKCPGCDTPLEIPDNARGLVKCPSCGNECIIDGLVKNAEIAAKENINSGIPLTASAETVHNMLVGHLAENPYIPLDVFEEITVNGERKLCAAGYCFECDASANYTYQAGNQRERTNVKTSTFSKDVTTKVEKYTEWTHMSSSCDLSHVVFCSGSKTLPQGANRLLYQLSPSDLVDIEELRYPADIETFGYDIPETSAFRDAAKPFIEILAEVEVEKRMAGKIFRDMEINSCRVDKDMKRVYISVIKATYSYKGQEYVFWLAGTGNHGHLDGCPVDEERKTLYDKKKAKTIGEKKGFIKYSILTALITYGAIASGVYLVLLPALYFALRLGLNIRNNVSLNAARKDFAEFDGMRKEAADRFTQAGRRLKGIYAPAPGSEPTAGENAVAATPAGA